MQENETPPNMPCPINQLKSICIYGSPLYNTIAEEIQKQINFMINEIEKDSLSYENLGIKSKEDVTLAKLVEMNRDSGTWMIRLRHRKICREQCLFGNPPIKVLSLNLDGDAKCEENEIRISRDITKPFVVNRKP